MEFKLYDNSLLLEINGTKVTYNGQTIESQDMVNEIHEYFMSNMDRFCDYIAYMATSESSSENMHRINFYDEFFIDETFEVLGNSEKPEVAEIYNETKEVVLSIAQKYFN